MLLGLIRSASVVTTWNGSELVPLPVTPVWSTGVSSALKSSSRTPVPHEPGRPPKNESRSSPT